MKRAEWSVSAGAVLLFAVLFFFDSSGIISAAVPAVCVHELGHLLPLRLCHHPAHRISVSIFGLEIDYAGRLEGWPAAVCIAGGPVAGLLYAVAACTFGGAFWRMSGAVSFLLTAFNLLPVLPLDGGRLTAAVTGNRAARRISRGTAVLLLLGGAAAAVFAHALSLLLTGAWLTACNFRSGFDDISEF